MEYAFKAVNTFGMTSIAVRGTDSVVVCTQKKIPDKMIVPDSVTNMYSVTDAVGACIVGNMNDARFIGSWLRNQAAEFKMQFQYEPSVQILATRLGN